MSIRARLVRQIARAAIYDRLRYPCPEAIILVTPDGDGVILHVNSGGNALACQAALTGAGFTVLPGWDFPNEPPMQADYGVKLRIIPGPIQRQARNLLGCEWGRKISLPGDSRPCEAVAAQRIVLHNGPAELLVQLCHRHAKTVIEQTDPHRPAEGDPR